MDHSSAMKLTQTSSPLKVDGILEIENILRLINKSHVKDKRKKDVNYCIGSDPLSLLKVTEKGSKMSNYLPVGSASPTSLGAGFGKMNKNSDSRNSDMVEILRRMLDKTLQAVKVSQTKIAEANKRHEASQLEIQKLQDEVRNLRAQINPPQLQLMKGISSLSTGNKRRRLNSPSSSESRSRSTSSSRNHSSRRSESPPQLSPAFIPRPVSTSIHSNSTRARYDSPNSSSYFSECYESDSRYSNNFSHDFDIEETQFPDVSKYSAAHKSKTSFPMSTTSLHSQNKVQSGTNNKSGDSKIPGVKPTLKSNMKNTSHLMNISTDSSKHSKSGKSHHRSHLRSSSKRRSYSSATYGNNIHALSISSPSLRHSSSAGKSAFASANNSSALNAASNKPLLIQTVDPLKKCSGNSSSSYKVTRSSSLNRDKTLSESFKPGSKQMPTSHTRSGLSSKPSSGIGVKHTRQYSNLGPPILENSAEPESEEEFDAFTFAKNDDDDSEELVDIDDDLPEIPPILPIPSCTSKKVQTLSPSSNLLGVSSTTSKLKGSASYGTGRGDSVGLKMPNIRSQSSASMPSSPLSSVGSKKSSTNKAVKAMSGRLDLSKFKSLHNRSRSSNSGSVMKMPSRTEKSSRNIRHSLPSMRKYTQKQEEPRASTRVHIVNPFPVRHFDKKIDYSYYTKGKTSNLHSPNYFDEDLKVKVEDENSCVGTSAAGKRSKFDSCAEITKSTASGNKGFPSSSKKAKDLVERFAIRINEGENCMMAQVPYQFYESETNHERVVSVEMENEDELVKTCKKSPEAKVVEIPRWRERVFEPYDLNELGPVTEENLDDQVFLKRHSKSEVNERRRKRWDSQRMREESYLERLKRKREERENQKKQRRRRGRNLQNDKGIQDTDMETFQPTIQDAVYIRNDNEIPITVFGYPLPIIEKEEFELPWAIPTKTPKSVKKAEPSKIQPTTTPTKTGLKTALRQSKR